MTAHIACDETVNVRQSAFVTAQPFQFWLQSVKNNVHMY